MAQLYPGVMHAMIFWGFIVLAMATTVVMLDYDFGIPIMHGYFYLIFQSFITDLFRAGDYWHWHGDATPLDLATAAPDLHA